MQANYKTLCTKFFVANDGRDAAMVALQGALSKCNTYDDILTHKAVFMSAYIGHKLGAAAGKAYTSEGYAGIKPYADAKRVNQNGLSLFTLILARTERAFPEWERPANPDGKGSNGGKRKAKDTPVSDTSSSPSIDKALHAEPDPISRLIDNAQIRALLELWAGHAESDVTITSFLAATLRVAKAPKAKAPAKRASRVQAAIEGMESDD